MRLRIQTQNPLPELKAWFIPDLPSVPTTIYELKEALCERVQTLKEDGQCDAQTIVLLLDDFELLDDSPFSAVRDGDLLIIKLSATAQVVNDKGKHRGAQVAVHGKKRKRTESPQRPSSLSSQSVKKPRAGPSVIKKHATKHQEESSSESEESSDESSSSESEDSNSSSASSSSASSSSSSTSSSSTSTSSPPAPKKPITSTSTKSIKKPTQPPFTVRKPDTSTTHVPPGHGKPSTHSRNQRRKKRREQEKALLTTLSQTPAPPKSVSSTNGMPLGSSSTPIATATVKKPSIAPSLNHHPSKHSTLTSAPAPVPGPSLQNALLAQSTQSQPVPSTSTSTSAPSPTAAPKKRIRTSTQRDRVGPASDVAFALNQAFGLNAKAGEYIPGDTRDVDDENEDDEPEVIDVDAIDAQTADGSSASASKAKGAESKVKKVDAKGGPGYVTLTPDQIMMGSLRNKNKKKGFKQSMAGPIPLKIVFSSESPAGPSAGPSGSASVGLAPRTSSKDQFENEAMDVDVDEPGNDSLTYPPSEGAAPASTSTPPARRPRLIPPSEIQARGELPPRVFVTSVDVEAGLWDDATTNHQHGQYDNNTASGSGSGSGSSKNKKNRKKRKAQSQDQYRQGSYDQEDQDQDVDQGDSAEAVEASLVLKYSEEDDSNPGATGGVPTPQGKDVFDWEKAEKMYEESKLVRSMDELVVGGVIGWKTLDINPATFTPEHMLFLARVVKVPSSTQSDATQAEAQDNKGHVIIKRILRSQLEEGGASRAALAFGLHFSAGGGNELEDEDGGGEEGKEEEEEEAIEWNQTLEWRVLEL